MTHSSELHGLLLASIERAVIATDMTGSIIFWNRFAERLYSWPADSVLGSRIEAVVPAINDLFEPEQLEQGLASGRSWSGEFAIWRRDGSTVVAQVSNSPIRDNEGRVVGIVSVAIDLSHDARSPSKSKGRCRDFTEVAPDLLRETGERFRTEIGGDSRAIFGLAEEEQIGRTASEATLRLRGRALESFGEGIMITSAAEFDNPVLYVNPAFERLTGYTREEAVGRNARFLQGDETDKNTIRSIRSAMEKGAPFRGSILNYRKDGTTFWNALTISPVRDTNGRTTHFVAILSDETERVQLASQLRQAQKMESLGHLTGGVAHDFNNLLAVILGNSEILYDEIADPELKKIAELVMTTAEKGADLTQRLLAFGRRQALHPEVLDLGTVIGSLSDMLRGTLGNGVRLETQSTTDRPAYIDRRLFESAILNLAVNARDAMPNGGLLTINAEVVRSEAGGVAGLEAGLYAKVTVADTGEGMKQEVLDRALDPFFTTKGIGKGSGMGLSMVYGFAKQSGGHVTIESKFGQGTSVHLYLPVSARETETKQPLIEARQDPPAVCGHERILLVEDEPHVRRFVSNQLTGLGYSVLEAEAGASALEILKKEQERIDLLFTDLLMPGGMSGFELAKHAREFLPALKVLLTTGYAAETDTMLRDVKDVILKKPYKKQQLALALRSVLEQAA